MARIGATLSGMERVLLNRLAEANAAVAMGTLRQATGRKINTPADNPSAFVALAGLQNQLTGAVSAMANVTAASSMVSQTQSTLGEVRAQLGLIRAELLTDEDHALPPSERAAAQAKIDTAIEEINALASTAIDGRRLLDGSADYVLSGQNRNQVRELVVRSTVRGSTATISANVSQAATQGQLVYTGAGGQITDDATLTLTGPLGSISLTVHGGGSPDDLDDIAQTVNDSSHKTGVTASVVGDELRFTTVRYGSRAAVAIDVSSGTFTVAGTGTGSDAVATINGQAYGGPAQVDGNRVAVNRNGLQFEIEFAPGFNGPMESIGVFGSALTFALNTRSDARTTLAISSVQATRLGGLSGRLDQLGTGGAYSGLDGNTSRALRIVDEAFGQLDRLEGAVDGFFNSAITTSSALLADLQEELETAIKQTDGYDEQEEKILLAKNEALASNAIASLAILTQQRSSIVAMIQHLAGLD